MVNLCFTGCEHSDMQEVKGGVWLGRVMFG